MWNGKGRPESSCGVRGTGMLQGYDLCVGGLAQAVLPVLLFPGSPLSQAGQGAAP